MTKKANKKKQKRIRTIAVIVSAILAIIILCSLRSGYLAGHAVGGEIMILFLPLIAYYACSNTTLSIEVLGKNEDEFDEYKSQAISRPKRVNAKKPKVSATIRNSTRAEDYKR
jgi:hypothetical protein